MKKSGISQIPRGMAENTVEMRKDSAKSGNVGMSGGGMLIPWVEHQTCEQEVPFDSRMKCGHVGTGQVNGALVR